MIVDLKVKVVCSMCGKELIAGVAADFPDDCDMLLEVDPHSCETEEETVETIDEDGCELTT